MPPTLMLTYQGPENESIEVKVGTFPGQPPEVYRCEAGGTVEAPAAYVEVLGRSGLVPVQPKAKAVAVAEVAASPKPVKAEVVVAPEAPAQVVIGEPSASAEPAPVAPVAKDAPALADAGRKKHGK